MAPKVFGFRSARSRDGEGYSHHPWRGHVPLPPRVFALAHPCGSIAPDCSPGKGSSRATVPKGNRNADAQVDPKVAETSRQANSLGLIRDNALHQEDNEERWPTNS
jgi:hypothetical protein